MSNDEILIKKAISVCRAKLNDQAALRELPTFPYFLFNIQEKSTSKESIRIKYSFTMNRRDFMDNLRPLLEFCTFNEFKETFYDNDMNNFMRSNCWIKKVVSKSGDEFYSIKSPVVEPSSKDNKSSLVIYPEIRLQCTDEGTPKNWSIDEAILYGMLLVYSGMKPKYELKVHRTEFQFKDNPNVKVNLDRVSFSNGDGCVIYSLFGDVSSNFFDNYLTNDITSQTEDCSFQNTMKPCRSKIIQFLETEQPNIYSYLSEEKLIPSLNYVTISLFEYEAQRIRYRWEEYNKKAKVKKEEEYIELAVAAALFGQASLVYEDEDGNELPYYSDAYYYEE